MNATNSKNFDSVAKSQNQPQGLRFRLAGHPTSDLTMSEYYAKANRQFVKEIKNARVVRAEEKYEADEARLGRIIMPFNNDEAGFAAQIYDKDMMEIDAKCMSKVRQAEREYQLKLQQAKKLRFQPEKPKQLNFFEKLMEKNNQFMGKYFGP